MAPHLMRTIGHGLVAGAAGTTVLNAVTYLDMAARARPASTAPEDLVDDLAERAGRPIPGQGEERTNRRTALGALGGIATGLTVGVLAAGVRAAGARLPLPVAGAAVAGLAMAATDAPLAATGVSDPRSWSGSQWAADLVPHVAFGLVTVAVLRRLR